MIPYGLVMSGTRAVLNGLNLIGLQRMGVEKEMIFELQKAYKFLFDKQSDLTFAERIKKLDNNTELNGNPLVMKLIDFVQHPSKNNIMQAE